MITGEGCPQSTTCNTAPAPNLAVVRGRQVVTGERSGDGDRRQRSQQVLVRLTPAEHADATALAARHSLSLPALLRAGLTYLAATEVPS